MTDFDGWMLRVMIGGWWVVGMCWMTNCRILCCAYCLCGVWVELYLYIECYQNRDYVIYTQELNLYLVCNIPFTIIQEIGFGGGFLLIRFFPRKFYVLSLLVWIFCLLCYLVNVNLNYCNLKFKVTFSPLLFKFNTVEGVSMLFFPYRFRN